MPSFRKPSKLSASDSAALEKLRGDEFLVFTGGRFNGKRGSGRFESTRVYGGKVGVPYPVKRYALDALSAKGEGEGYSPSISVGGLRNAATPPGAGLPSGAVYLFVEKDAKGNFVASVDIPTADPRYFPKGLKRGDIVIKAGANKLPALASE